MDYSTSSYSTTKYDSNSVTSTYSGKKSIPICCMKEPACPGCVNGRR